MQTQAIRLSPLPRPTWGWLNINDTALPITDTVPPYTGNPLVQVPRPISFAEAPGRLDIPSAILAETAGYVDQQVNYNLTLFVPEGAKVTDPVELTFQLGSENPCLVDNLHIQLAPGSTATVILRYTGGSDTPVHHWGHLSLDIAEDARLNLIYVQALDHSAIHAGAIHGLVQAGGELNVVLGELGGSQAVSGCDITLAGDSAAAQINSLYLGSGNARRDMNYRLVYQGRETQGGISARGALSGRAKKTLKSTIDFLTGASGAKGSEEESVLVLSDQVRNISTPLLLCREDNVEGRHATNIGRPDAAQLYYLMSRGFTELESRKLLVEASFTPLLAQLPTAELREEMTAFIREVIDNGQ